MRTFAISRRGAFLGLSDAAVSLAKTAESNRDDVGCRLGWAKCIGWGQVT